MGAQAEEEGTHHHMVYRLKGTPVQQWNQRLRPMPHQEAIHHQQRQRKTAKQKIGIDIQMPPEQVQPHKFHQGYYVSISSTSPIPFSSRPLRPTQVPFRVCINRIWATVNSV